MSDRSYPAVMRLQIALVGLGGFALFATTLILILHGSAESLHVFAPILGWGGIAVVLACLLRTRGDKVLEMFGYMWLIFAAAAYIWLRWTHG